jgi:hypothetical protein
MTTSTGNYLYVLSRSDPDFAAIANWMLHNYGANVWLWPNEESYNLKFTAEEYSRFCRFLAFLKTFDLTFPRHMIGDDNR